MSSYAMLRRAMTLLSRMLWLPLSQWLVTIAYLFLAWLIQSPQLFSDLPYAVMQRPPFQL
jgi:competence protein ComEC